MKSMLDQLKPELHIPTAFQKCGLCPVNPAKALERIPHVLATDSIAKHVDASLLKKLEESRFKKKVQATKGRGKKMSVEAGRSYTSVDDSDDSDSQDSVSGSEVVDDVSMEEESEEEEEEVDELPDLLEPDGEEASAGEPQPRQSGSQPGSSKCRQPGSYVIARYDNEWYVAQVVNNQENVQAGYILLHYMDKKGRNHFMWNKEKEDMLLTLHEDILMDIPAPIPVTSRFMGVSDKTVSEAERLLVVVVLIFIFYACELSQKIRGCTRMRMHANCLKKIRGEGVR
jgi:hypothetical protein